MRAGEEEEEEASWATMRCDDGSLRLFSIHETWCWRVAGSDSGKLFLLRIVSRKASIMMSAMSETSSVVATRSRTLFDIAGDEVLRERQSLMMCRIVYDTGDDKIED